MVPNHFMVQQHGTADLDHKNVTWNTNQTCRAVKDFKEDSRYFLLSIKIIDRYLFLVHKRIEYKV